MPDINSTELKNESEVFELISEKAFTTISLGLGSVIIVINIASLAFLIRHRTCVTGSGLWQQFIFLCFTDMFSGIGISVFNLGLFFLHIHASIYFSLCVTGILVYPTTATLSAGNCLIISIQRYISVRTIDQQVIKIDKHTTLWVILSNVAICVLTITSSVAVITIRFGFHYEEFCNMINLSGQNYYKSHYLAGPLILLMLLLLCTNITTILSIVKLTKVTKYSVSRGNSSLQSSSILKSQIERNRYATKTFVLIVLVLNLATIPSLLFWFVLAIRDVNMPAEITELVIRIMTVNSVLNPFIYSLRMVNFRNAVWNDIKALNTCFKCPCRTP